MIIIQTMDAYRSDLPLLISLQAMVEARSVTGAANRLGLSQPAMSAQLARLRDIFDDPLLVGNARGMEPTRKAAELVAQLNAPLAEIDRVFRASGGFDPGQSTENIIVAGSEYTNMVVGAPLLERLGQLAPNMRLALLAFQANRGGAQFAERDIDLALVTPSMVPDNMMRVPLFADDLVVVRRGGSTSGSSISEYCAAKHILVSTTGGSFTASVDIALAEKGLSRNVAASVQSFSVALGMAATSELWTTLPRYYANRWRALVEIVELPVNVPKFAFNMVWPQRVDSDPKHIWLREQILDIVAQMALPEGMSLTE